MISFLLEFLPPIESVVVRLVKIVEIVDQKIFPLDNEISNELA